MRPKPRTIMFLFMASFVFAGALILTISLFTHRGLAAGSNPPETDYTLYLPLVLDPQPPQVKLEAAWISDSQGAGEVSFHPDESMGYRIRVTNNLTTTTAVQLQWTQNDACGDNSYGHVYSDTLTVDTGDWLHVYLSTTPGCGGVYTPVVQLKHEGVVQTLHTEFAVNRDSRVFVSDKQAFDKCGLPEVWKMQEWWDSSPYEVFNLYLGGISFGCKNNPLDAVWARKVAEQGWTFIHTWVGPQAPCTNYIYRMSDNKNTAYNEGRAEAQAAAEAAYNLGFFGDVIIYYDLEAYGQDVASCHNAVRFFLNGWTERLHELGFKSGAYGASCSSYMTKWADVSPPLDDVWIANWYTPYAYDPDASVYNAACLSNSLWDNHERLRQYAGGHTETWGGVSITVDSNVLDGEINALDLGEKTGDRGAVDKGIGYGGGVELQITGTPVEDLGLFGIDLGWVQSEGRLLLTGDGGEVWLDVTPLDTIVMGVAFTDRVNGWLVGRLADGRLAVYQTADGGSTWTTSMMPLSVQESLGVAGAWIDPLDVDNAWVSLKLRSGGSFSLGRLFYTGDGGVSWQERDMPLGEAVTFLDDQEGSTAGGPDGGLLYSTLDGGRTWQQQEPSEFGHALEFAGEAGFSADQGGRLPGGTLAFDFADELHGWAAVQTSDCQGSKGAPNGVPLRCEQRWRLLATEDGGRTWRELSIR